MTQPSSFFQQLIKALFWTVAIIIIITCIYWIKDLLWMVFAIIILIVAIISAINLFGS